MDKIVGGVGLKRGRRDPRRLVNGEALDWWRVEDLQRGRSLRLRAEMRVPGRAWLELSVEPQGDGSIYRQRAVFFPKGLSGRLYWAALIPFHHFIFQGMAERIGALSMVHRMLYSAGDVTRFNLEEFADDFMSDLTAGIDPARTAVTAEVDPISLPAAIAAPLALMLHELATNAVRHAFPNDREGRVSISARRCETGLRLQIEDDGIGRNAAVPNPAGFGCSLVEMVVKQLRGVITWHEPGSGTRVEIVIPLQSESPRPATSAPREATLGQAG
jgi:two-component sensor histidine kinase